MASHLSPPPPAGIDLQPRRPSGRPRDNRIPSTGEIQVTNNQSQNTLYVYYVADTLCLMMLCLSHISGSQKKQSQ